MKKSKIWKYSAEEFKLMVEASESYSDLARKLGVRDQGNSSIIIRTRILEGNLSVTHFLATSALAQKYLSKKIPTEEILVKNSTYTSTFNLKHRLWSENLLERTCYICGLCEEWQGKSLSLQLDHINGDRRDNQLVNLRILCPNCHSQTESYCGKRNKVPKKVCVRCSGKRKELVEDKYCKKCFSFLQLLETRPSKEVLVSAVKEMGYVRTGALYSVSDNTIRKWLRDYGLSYRDIKKVRKKDKKLFCSVCPKEITRNAISGYCRSCSTKHKWASGEFKKKNIE
jgi:hypothetical protein